MRLALVLALSLCAAAAAAAPGPTIDPKIRRAIETGLDGPPPGAAPGRRGDTTAARRRRAGTAAVLLELKAPADPTALARLRTAGVRLREVAGRTLHYRQFVPAILDRAALARLATSTDVTRVSLVGARGPLPLDHSAELIGLDAARGARPALDLLTGQGIVVADLDTNIDVFHPVFFRADAGAYDWLDVDGDGVFTPGVDAIDLDHNGRADPGEVGRLLSAATLYMFTGRPAAARPPGFDPSVDWIYLDENGTGERDFGADAGFDDNTPAFGEPLFVPDDLDRSGVIERGERFFRLGTSKIRKLYVTLAPYVDFEHGYVRGVDLSAAEVNHTDGLYGYSDGLHATGVASIIAGDVALAGRRWVGMAPDVELVMGWEMAMPIATTVWALGEQPDVTLFEMSPWTGYVLDGSDALSRLLDEATATDQVTHTCPVGDQAGARKHAQATVPAQGTVTLPVEIPSSLGRFSYVDVSLNVRGASAPGLTVAVQEPGGQTHDLAAPPGLLSTGAFYWPTNETSDRGTRFIDVSLYTETPLLTPIPTGTWHLVLAGGAAGSATVDAYVSDDLSGFDEGAAFTSAEMTDLSTIGIPSTADHCIAVAAHTGHASSASEPWFYNYPPGGVGEVRDYSPWGPRIDGVTKPDIAGPDNPFAAAPHDQLWGYGSGVVPHGAFWPFGGTSGSAPHVTGVAALLAQTGVRGDAARDAIRAGAIVDAVTGAVPNDRYGWGRLSAAAALGAAADGAPPTLTLVPATAAVRTGEPVTLTPTAADPDGAAASLEVKWDDDYDGTWDAPYGPLAPRVVTSAAPALRPFKARVRDATGRFAEAVAWITWTDTPPPPDGGRDAGAADGPASPAAGDCSCRAAGAGRAAGPSALAVVALGLLARRRHR
jgi:hypothetical protein